MDTLARYGRGSWAFLRTVGADVLRWVWEDVTGLLRFVGAIVLTIFAVLLLVLSFGLFVSLLSAIF